jgi:hypothetical protein
MSFNHKSFCCTNPSKRNNEHLQHCLGGFQRQAGRLLEEAPDHASNVCRPHYSLRGQGFSEKKNHPLLLLHKQQKLTGFSPVRHHHARRRRLHKRLRANNGPPSHGAGNNLNLRQHHNFRLLHPRERGAPTESGQEQRQQAQPDVQPIPDRLGILRRHPRNHTCIFVIGPVFCA